MGELTLSNQLINTWRQTRVHGQETFTAFDPTRQEMYQGGKQGRRCTRNTLCGPECLVESGQRQALNLQTTHSTLNPQPLNHKRLQWATGGSVRFPTWQMPLRSVLEQISQSRPDSGLDSGHFQYKSLNRFTVLFPVRSEAARGSVHIDPLISFVFAFLCLC